jgi:hypothetical protein
MDFTNSQETKALCEALLYAETEDHVRNILVQQRLWKDLSLWRPYGDTSMNRSIVGNQQSSPTAAMVEKLVNSLDAVLTGECLRQGIDPRSTEAPRTMQEAVGCFFGVHEGRIQNLNPGERTDIAKRIELVVTGCKKNPNYIIIDTGEGQHPDSFPDTFLSLLRENKTGIPFVQGKFNMGGTGVLQFAGVHSFQLILSKRQPDIAYPTRSPDQDTPWGCTLVRRLDPEEGRPQSTYVYLAPNNLVPRFWSTELAVRPGRYPATYEQLLQAGTLVKLWNYKLPGYLKTNLMFDMRRALEKHLPEPALPIRLYERRTGYRAHSYETTMSGLSSVIADSPEDIEPGLDTGTPLSIDKVGRVRMRITVVKEDTVRGRNPKYPKGGVFFTVNGQLHSELDKGFIERWTKLDYIAGTTIVTVDCTQLPERIREDLFLGSRDRMRDCDERDTLYYAIADYVKDHPGLRELNARRRQERMAAAISEEETAKIIQDIVRTDPTLAELFGKGRKIKIPRGPDEEKGLYIGRQFPTYFRLHKEPPGGLVKKCPRNRRCRVLFETDASNDYFSRAKDAGRIDVAGTANLASVHLWDGRATLTFEVPENCSVGDLLNLTVEVMDISRVEPFRATLRIEVEHEVPREVGGERGRAAGSLFAGLPNIKEVRRPEWEQWGFNERTALAIHSAIEGESEELDIAINLDNLFLQNERARRRNMDADILNYWFKYGLCLLTLGMLYDRKQSDADRERGRSEAEETGGQYEDIENACRGLAITIIPVISQLSKEKKLVERF